MAKIPRIWCVVSSQLFSIENEAAGSYDSECHHLTIRRIEMAEEPEAVGHEHVIFNDEEHGVAVNAVPFTKALHIPRTGENLYLPGMKEGGSGYYEVESVTYIYREDEDPDEIGAAKLAKVNVRVKRVRQRPRV
jgi:hypothetical protein